MTRTIRTAAELDALPVGSVVLGADHPAEPRRPLGERISPRWDPDARWNVDGRHYYGATETVLAVLGGAVTVLHDPAAPVPAPSAATARHERAVAYADDVAEGGAPVPDDYERHYCTEDGEDWPCGAARAARVPEAAVERAARAMQAENAPKPDPLNRDQREEQDDATIATYRTLTRAVLAAALPLLTAAPSVVSDAAGLGDRIAALSARLAAVGFPACTCHPGDDDSERCLPRPQDWRAEIERAALSSTTLTAAPSATREATEDEVTEVVTEALTDAYRAERGMSRHTGLTAYDESVIRDQAAHVVNLADARFTITPKEDR